MASVKMVSFALTGFGSRIFGYRECPVGGSLDDPYVKQGHALADALKALSDKLASAPGATIPARRELIVGEHAFAQAKLAQFVVATNKLADALAKDQAKLDNPPPVSGATDVALDIEAREWFASCPQAKVFGEMAKGQHPSLLAALCRCEYSETGARARQIYRDRARVGNREQVAAFEREQERIEWGRSISAQVENTLNLETDKLGPSVLMDWPAAIPG